MGEIMREKTTVTEEDTIMDNIDSTDEKKESDKRIDLEKRVTVRNIAGWDISFPRRTGFGSESTSSGVTMAPGGTAVLDRQEIVAQVENGNKLFAGIDGRGSHATIYIEDSATRQYLGFEIKGKKKQNIFSDSLVKEVFAIQQQDVFQNKFNETFITRAEQYSVIQAIKRLGINDYSKIRFAEETTGWKVQ